MKTYKELVQKSFEKAQCTAVIEYLEKEELTILYSQEYIQAINRLIELELES
jgi:hypothetical protein